VVATNDRAEGNGFTPEWKSYDRVNFILVLHDDGTLGEYMHLAPHGVRVHAGQRVVRGQLLAASGNTGYSTAPHLHFKVMTAAPDGRSSISFPVDFLIAPRVIVSPREGAIYRGFEYHQSSALQ
jgi:murein DD-endopeptidase MepM/ murein hydrolase activator NlpD